MGQLESIDVALVLNARAQDEHWPVVCDSGLDFDRAELNELREIWRSRAARGTMPARADFGLRTLKPFLRHVSMIERVSAGAGRWRYRKRLSATATTERVGETMGRFLHEFVPPRTLCAWTCIVDTVLGAGVPLRVVAQSSDPRTPHLFSECFVAPLAGARDEATLVLVCTYTQPRWQSCAV